MIKRDNHYVPHSYLKRWADNNGMVWTYRTLVSHPNEYPWKPRSPKSIGFHQHLYTRMEVGGESDHIEDWFASKFEAPAAAAIQRVLCDEPLHPGDWPALIRFLAAQDVRTPARMLERLHHWNQIMPKLVEETLKESVKKLEAMVRAGHKIPKTQPIEHDELFPARTFIETLPGEEGGRLHLEATVGRGLWLWSLKQALSKTLSALSKHHWIVLRCPSGWNWLTSDDPVIRLNYRSDKDYDFKGGWNSRGTEIFMPLSPTHLMYTQIGTRPALGKVAPLYIAAQLQRFTIEHAHRYVFGPAADRQVALWRPRIIDKAACDAETAQWDTWNIQQSEAESALLRMRTK
ncbi:DUF4238 domain-containing protein [Massilia sp. MB5]|uniref:DUF4238 domain-containing protein n=1 Tax=Massilia sp. MB5 TaxID=2919578 RepID=UPI001F0F5976|nr:DUF4238 domain-containing protein [Massilia sp. MB5]UMR31332.1 DUF4238 domain-containing protein [Massilia sp. MB5]